MGLSNYLPSSRLIQPGVCTSTTRPASPFNGQVIYETDTKQTLVWQGSSWVMLTDADSPPGLELVKTQTVGSAVASVEVTSAFSSTHDNYKIVYMGGSCSSQGDLKMTLGSTTSGYYNNVIYTAWNNTVAAASTNNGSSWERAGISETVNSLQIELYGPFLSQRTVMWGTFVGADSTRVGGSTSGFLANTTSYTSFTITTTAGTLTGGTIRVYGYRNSI
jgi:hypothetical protein